MEISEHVPSYGQCFVSLALGLAPFLLLLGVAALFGADTITSGGRHIHGLGAVLVALIVNTIFAAIFAGIQKLGYGILGLIPRKQSDPEY